ncbi:centromere protein I isoform X2 [Nomia melanderi]|uniref:centromere protein I isoform X2 n=1 Tax=Nomia melanderi TaxID=2448451 RepID=UPI003FCC6974
MDSKVQNDCVIFLQTLKAKGKSFHNFRNSLNTLQTYLASKGLEDEDINLLANIIINTDLGATKLKDLIKCLIPRRKIPERTFKLIATWCLSSVNEIPITVSIIIMQWIIGLWDYQLIDRKVINIYYSVLFYVMLKKERLEKHIAYLIYVLTKPEDVTRRNVTRLITLQQKYSHPQRHIVVLLSLFKSYKPELVPEKIESINIESVWKPIPEKLQKMLQAAKERSEIQEMQSLHFKSYNWNTFEIGSRIFKEKDTSSIFDISCIEDLGKSHFSMEFPCNAISLLTNTAGYHLLTFADFHYQYRFCYNLYNTLIRAFILENDKFSEEEINKLLDMTAEFSRYMQQGVLVVNHFLSEYLYFNTGEHQSKLLTLLQWISSTSVSDLQEKVLVHVQNIYYESFLNAKCEIIRTLRMLITNLFVNQGFKESYQKTPAPFLRGALVDNFEEIISTLTKFSKDLIVSGLNIHVYDTLLLSEALSFYEEVCNLEKRNTVIGFTLAPPAVIYGGFLTSSCAILSRICKLLLRYHKMSIKFSRNKQQRERSVLKRNLKIISVYVQDIIDALWHDKPFKKRKNKYLFNTISMKVLDDLEYCNLNELLNISNHFAILPYICVLTKAGLNISTKEDARSTSLYYYPMINEFINIF